jgi:hypothetical protein
VPFAFTTHNLQTNFSEPFHLFSADLPKELLGFGLACSRPKRERKANLIACSNIAVPKGERSLVRKGQRLAFPRACKLFGQNEPERLQRNRRAKRKGVASALHFEKRLFAAPTPSTLPLKVSLAVAV